MKLLKNYPKTILYNCFDLCEKNNIDTRNFYFEHTPFIKLYFKKFKIQTQIIGDYNVQNIAASIIISEHFGVSLENISKTLEKLELTNNRSQLINTQNNRILLDAYNANPTSVTLAIQSFKKLVTNEKYKENLIILGDMLELGQSTLRHHQNIIYLLEKCNFKNCILIGNNFQKTKTHYSKILSIDECLLILKKEKISNKTILIKGSRNMKLERIVKYL